MTPKIEDMSRDEFRSHMTARIRELFKQAQIDDNTVDHWNRMHPNEEPIAGGFVKQLREQLTASGVLAPAKEMP